MTIRTGNSNGRLAARLLLLACGMLALSFASVPLYDWFCRVTGFGGETRVASTAAADSDIMEQTVRVRFDASLEAGMPWEFEPVERQMTLRIGETAMVFYRAKNPTDEVLAGSASFNVYPYAAGLYFNKIECFCFQKQVLEPGEEVRMPVSFFVDPEILEDPDSEYIRSITLSYTFHLADLPEQHARLASPGETELN